MSLYSIKRFICCALIILHSIDSKVGRSIASISDLGGIYIYLGSDISAIDLPTILYILHICQKPKRVIHITEIVEVVISVTIYQAVSNMYTYALWEQHLWHAVLKPYTMVLGSSSMWPMTVCVAGDVHASKLQSGYTDCLWLDDLYWSSNCGGVPSIGLPMLWLHSPSFHDHVHIYIPAKHC